MEHPNQKAEMQKSKIKRNRRETISRTWVPKNENAALWAEPRIHLVKGKVNAD